MTKVYQIIAYPPHGERLIYDRTVAGLRDARTYDGTGSAYESKEEAEAKAVLIRALRKDYLVHVQERLIQSH